MVVKSSIKRTSAERVQDGRAKEIQEEDKQSNYLRPKRFCVSVLYVDASA